MRPRRDLICGALAVVLVPATVMTVLHWLPAPETTDLVYASPAHRVAVAVEEAMRAELASVVPGPFWVMLAPAPGTLSYVGVPFSPFATAVVSDAETTFTCQVGGLGPPMTVGLIFVDFKGKARDGRAVKVSVGGGLGEETTVACDGDAALTRALGPRIAHRLAHPRQKPGSPEDREAMAAFFRGKTVIQAQIGTGTGMAPAPAPSPPPSAEVEAEAEPETP